MLFAGAASSADGAHEVHAHGGHNHHGDAELLISGGAVFCNGSTAMGMNGLGGNGRDCLIFLFEGLLLDSRAKYAMGVAAAFLMGIMCEGLRAPRAAQIRERRRNRSLPPLAHLPVRHRACGWHFGWRCADGGSFLASGVPPSPTAGARQPRPHVSHRCSWRTCSCCW